MSEEGEDTVDSVNDNVTIFDQVERHLAETEAPFDYPSMSKPVLAA